MFPFLPDDVLDNVFSFVGAGSFLYVATTCTRFNAVYYKEGTRNKETTFDSAASSITCAEMCLEEITDPEFRDKAFEKIVKTAAEKGRLNIVKWAYKQKKLLCKPFWFLEPAGFHGQLGVLEFARNEGIYDAEYDNVICVAESACIAGRIPVFEWLHRNDLLVGLPRIDYDVISYRIGSHGQLAVADWLIDHGYSLKDDLLVDGAINGNQLEATLWAWRRGGVEIVDGQYIYFCEHEQGAVSFLRGLLEAQCPWGRHILSHIFLHGGCPRIQAWAIENGWWEE